MRRESTVFMPRGDLKQEDFTVQEDGIRQKSGCLTPMR
jgi:hypothetical protein